MSDREQCQHVEPRERERALRAGMTEGEAEAMARCIRPGRLFSTNLGPRPAGWWCVLHQGAASPVPDPRRTMQGIARRDALAGVVRACSRAMQAGATGPELMEAYRQAERCQQQLEGVGG
jgi:hypothetical protein